MLPAAYRLPKEEIRAVFAGKKFFAPPVILYFQEKPQGISQMAIVVGKRVCHLSTKRNRIKRLFRREITCLLPHLTKTINGVVVVQSIPTPLDHKNINLSLKKLFTKAQLL